MNIFKLIFTYETKISQKNNNASLHNLLAIYINLLQNKLQIVFSWSLIILLKTTATKKHILKIILIPISSQRSFNYMALAHCLGNGNLPVIPLQGECPICSPESCLKASMSAAIPSQSQHGRKTKVTSSKETSCCHKYQHFRFQNKYAVMKTMIFQKGCNP